MRAPERGDVYFVGGTTHPGGGIPLVLLSGKMVAEMIEKENDLMTLDARSKKSSSARSCSGARRG